MCEGEGKRVRGGQACVRGLPWSRQRLWWAAVTVMLMVLYSRFHHKMKKIATGSSYDFRVL